jgi:hypothetical protein
MGTDKHQGFKFSSLISHWNTVKVFYIRIERKIFSTTKKTFIFRKMN